MTRQPRYDVWTIDEHSPTTDGRARLARRSLTEAAAHKRAAHGNERHGRDGYALRYVVVPEGATPEGEHERRPVTLPAIDVGYRST